MQHYPLLITMAFDILATATDDVRADSRSRMTLVMLANWIMIVGLLIVIVIVCIWFEDICLIMEWLWYEIRYTLQDTEEGE